VEQKTVLQADETIDSMPLPRDLVINTGDASFPNKANEFGSGANSKTELRPKESAQHSKDKSP